MQTTTTQKNFRPIGLSAFERFNLPSTCGCCGREGLKKTVKMTDGTTIVFMGTGCAQKAMDIDPDNFKAAQKRTQLRWDRGGAYRAFLDAICPAFAGSEEKQIVLTNCLDLFGTWEKTGKVGQPSVNNARVQASKLSAMIMGHDVDGNSVTSPFTSEDMPIVVAWRDHLRTIARGG